MATTKQITRNLGGDRLGSGKKNNIDLHAYNRSSHDLSRTWRSSMNVGTLVPFFVELGLNGDSFTINLDNITRTLPSIGPLYGSYKLQIDMFECPIRLYNGLLHNNMAGIGMKMSKVKFPKITLQALVKNRSVFNEDLNKSQISKSSLINYLGLNGIGDCDFTDIVDNSHVVGRKFNAMPLLMYWDIYKNYYANKQEEKGAYICANPTTKLNNAKKIEFANEYFHYRKNLSINYDPPMAIENTEIYEKVEINDEYGRSLSDVTDVKISEFEESANKTLMYVIIYNNLNQRYTKVPITTFGSVNILTDGTIEIHLSRQYSYKGNFYLNGFVMEKQIISADEGLMIKTFDLEEIDNMRLAVLNNAGLNNELQVNNIDGELWGDMYAVDEFNTTLFKYHQHGLALKTYQSDLYNNWLQTEWIDGEEGINRITAIDTSSGSFEIDALILGKKIYNMLNRIAVSGGSYDDWQEAVYSVEAIRKAETPIYRGGMSAEIMFSEVVSNAATEEDPLGTLAGKGGEHNKKGGQIEISCEEACIMIGIVSITPRVDYSQGNSWILTELDNMDDLHKPQLDGIGFQDLLQERMAYWGTVKRTEGWEKLAAGKVPAWINYMTAVNETHGDFAEEDKCMFMTLNRRYEFKLGDVSTRNDFGIADLTTYIDPAKYNYIFADANLQAQNFWIQIGIGVNARRVMSAKVIPFL